MNSRRRPILEIATKLVLGLCLYGASAHPQDARSGYEYLDTETRAMQDDDFSNPGMFWGRDYGIAVYRSREGVENSSCATCHGEPNALRGASTRYPRVDTETGRIINLEGRINRCRTEQMKLPALPYESELLLALTTVVAHQSRGMPLDWETNPITEPFLQAGRSFYYQRRGQLDLSCANCHIENAGKRLRGEVISQGQINGFPTYRLSWQDLGSTHRMFAWCNEAVRAEPYALGSKEYLSLELYLRSRARGLKVESPAVRR